MECNLEAMASNLEAMAYNLEVMASSLEVIDVEWVAPGVETFCNFCQT